MNLAKLLGLALGAIGTSILIKQATQQHVAEQDAYFEQATKTRAELLRGAENSGPFWASRQAGINNMSDRWCADRQVDIHAAPVTSWLARMFEG